MVYLKQIILPTFEEEANASQCPTVYPFGIFPYKDLDIISFSPITILYGSNGSGKSTLLNVFAEKLILFRKAPFYKDEQFLRYVQACNFITETDDQGNQESIPQGSKIITSEDIFDFIVGIRKDNIRIDEDKLRQEQIYNDAKYSNFKYKNLDDYDQLVLKVAAMKKTKTSFIRGRTKENIRQYSNGENVLKFFDSEIENDKLYLLDEPENCLSPKFLIDLVKLLQQCARYCDCQFIIATHSPFILSIKDAKIYNLDANPVSVDKWTDLENVRLYYEFFKMHDDEFNEN
jgi:predicted ATPase